MGTRSLTIFTEKLDDASKEICVLYRQMDGYPTGHGRDLKECLSKAQLGNGIPGGLDLSDGSKFFNGMSDLAVQTITRLKKIELDREIESEKVLGHITGKPKSIEQMGDLRPGQFYLYKSGTRDCGEEYIYTVYSKDNVVCLQVNSCYRGELYNGPVNDFDPDNAESEECEEC